MPTYLEAYRAARASEQQAAGSTPGPAHLPDNGIKAGVTSQGAAQDSDAKKKQVVGGAGGTAQNGKVSAKKRKSDAIVTPKKGTAANASPGALY